MCDYDKDTDSYDPNWLARTNPTVIEDACYAVGCSFCRKEFDERAVPKDLLDPEHELYFALTTAA